MTDDDQVINLLDRRKRSSTNAAEMAMLQLLNARQATGLEPSAFADALAPYLAWNPTPELVKTWESQVPPPGDVLVAAQAIAAASNDPAADLPAPLSPEADLKLGGIESAFRSRSEFVAKVPIYDLLGSASKIEASGLSLNLICQQHSSTSLALQLESGTEVECLFLRPGGAAIRNREVEEHYEPGDLSALTRLNANILRQQVRAALTTEAAQRLRIGTYDETLRFNMIFVDDRICIFQPYLHSQRGIENPTLIVHRVDDEQGIYHTLRESYEWLRSQASFEDA